MISDFLQRNPRDFALNLMQKRRGTHAQRIQNMRRVDIRSTATACIDDGDFCDCAARSMRAENARDFSGENRADLDEFLQNFRAQRARKACKICAETSSLSYSSSVSTLVPHVLRAFCADLRG